jgi:hypothetical protein
MTVAEGSSTNVTRYEFEAHASAARSARSSDGDGTACTRRGEVQIEMSPLCTGVGEIEREPERRWAGRFEPPPPPTRASRASGPIWNGFYKRAVQEAESACWQTHEANCMADHNPKLDERSA